MERTVEQRAFSRCTAPSPPLLEAAPFIMNHYYYPLVIKNEYGKSSREMAMQAVHSE